MQIIFEEGDTVEILDSIDAGICAASTVELQSKVGDTTWKVAIIESYSDDDEIGTEHIIDEEYFLTP